MARDTGDIDNGNAPCGQSAGLIHEIRPAGDVVRALLHEAEQVLAGLRSRTESVSDSGR